jgi:hypothetical protein
MITLGFVILAAIANSIMDTLKFRFTRSVFNRPGSKLYNFSEPLSWKRKWKNKDSSQGEAFLFSSTILVFLTDLWHFAQMIMKLSFILGIVLYQPIFNWYYDLIIYSISFSIIFELNFSKFLITWKK